MADKTGKSHLLDCASEIRNAIYEYVLSFDNPIIRGKPEEDASTSLALLQVCKSVEREAAPIFYERNLFRFNFRHHHSALENDPDLCDARVEQGLSSYDDAQMTWPMIDVPKRHINSLRHVNLVKELSGYWPNGPLDNGTLGPEGLGIPLIEKIINFLAARNSILSSLSITLRRMQRCGEIGWDPDPSTLLRELDAERRFSTSVGKLVNLSRLEIWKSRVSIRRPKVKIPSEWTAVPSEVLERVKFDHFPKAKAVLYIRRAENENINPRVMAQPFAEQFLIDFQQAEVKGRKLEYLSEVERKGLYDETGT